MLTRVRIWLIACAAIAALLAIAGNGSARRLSFEGATFRIVFNPLTFRSSAGEEIRCRVTLGGTWVGENLAKAATSTMGRITEATAAPENCGVEFLTETLPWEVKYRAFTGTLPRIEQIETVFRPMAWRLRFSLFRSCLFATTIGSDVFANWVFEATRGRENLVILVNVASERIFAGTECTGLYETLSGTGRPTFRGTEIFFQVFLVA